jgi:hypothetical protein
MKFVKDRKNLCLEYGTHRALFRFRGKVKRDKEHTLCFRCFHSVSDAWRARRLAGLGA